MIILIGILFILSAFAYWKKIPYSSGSLLYSLSSVFIIAVNLSLLFRLLNKPFEHYYESIEGQLLLLIWCLNIFELIWSSKAISRLFSAIMIVIILKLGSYLSIEVSIPDDLILMLKPKWLELSNNLMLVSYFILVFGSFLSTTLFIYILVFLLNDPTVNDRKNIPKPISMPKVISIINEYFSEEKKKKRKKKEKNKPTENQDKIFDRTSLVELIAKKKDITFDQASLLELTSLLELITNVDKTELNLANLTEFEEKKENQSTKEKKSLLDQLSFSELKTIINKIEAIDRFEKRVQIFNTASTYSIIIGHISLTLAIFIGAIGAKESFNIYWFWNAKEVWSLVIWLIFTLYLHVSFIRRGSSFQKSGFGFIGFGIIWISYFYINSFFY